MHWLIYKYRDVIFLTHWGWGKMDATLADDIFKCIFLNENFRILNKFP